MKRGDKVEIVQIIPGVPPALIKTTTIHKATVHEVASEYIQVNVGNQTLVLPWATINQIVIENE